jgi:thiol-disulfide isomerase/thioredoxin
LNNYVRRRLIFSGVGFVVAGALAVGLFGHFGSPSTSLDAGATLPSSVPALNGHGKISLPKLGSVQREPVMITFFASWCGPCSTEIPAVARYAKSEQTKGAKISFIGIDENDPTGGRAFVKKSGLTFAVGTDLDGNVLQDLGFEAALPQTVFINSKGQIVEHVLGSVMSGSQLQTWVGKLTS